DRPTLYANLFFLMTICFVPFPTAILTRYGQLTTAVVFYSVSMAFGGLTLALLWWLAAIRPAHRKPQRRMGAYFALRAIGMALVVAAVSGARAVMAAAPPRYAVANVRPYGGEPSIVSDHLGRLYDTTPSGGTITYRSVDHGATWTPTAIADPSSGDDCLATDQENSVYLCNLAGSEGAAPLQADGWKSTNLGASWSHGSAFIPQCGSTSCSPFGVDRDWVAASIPQGGHTNTAEVVLMYHDFYG